MDPRATSFTKEIYRQDNDLIWHTENESRGADNQVDPANNDEHLFNSSTGDPVVDEKRKCEGQSILEKVDLVIRIRSF